MMSAKQSERKKERTKGLRVDAATACLLIVILLTSLFPASVAAHPPQEVALSYDQARHMLEVRITHPSKDPSSHYLKKVEVKRADKILVAAEYKSQPAEAVIAYAYPMEIGAGDLVEVTATCSIFGSKTAKLDMRNTPR